MAIHITQGGATTQNFHGNKISRSRSELIYAPRKGKKVPTIGPKGETLTTLWKHERGVDDEKDHG